MAATFTIVARIAVDKAGSAEVVGLGSKVEGSMNRAGRAINSVQSQLRALAAGAGIGFLVKQVLDVGAAYESLLVQLETVEGSQARANARFQELRDFATSTPFELDSITQAYVRLRAVGITPTSDLMRSIGDTASAFGRNITDFSNAVVAATTGEMESLKGFGIVAKQENDKVRFLFKGTETVVKKEASAIVGYLKGIGETDFVGSMERQSQTLTGRISTMKDAWRDFTFELYQGGFDQSAKDVIVGLTQIAKWLSVVLVSIGGVSGGVALFRSAWATSMAGIVGSTGNAVAGVVQFFADLQLRLSQIGGEIVSSPLVQVAAVVVPGLSSSLAQLERSMDTSRDASRRWSRAADGLRQSAEDLASGFAGVADEQAQIAADALQRQLRATAALMDDIGGSTGNAAERAALLRARLKQVREELSTDRVSFVRKMSDELDEINAKMFAIGHQAELIATALEFGVNPLRELDSETKAWLENLIRVRSVASEVARIIDDLEQANVEMLGAPATAAEIGQRYGEAIADELDQASFDLTVAWLDVNKEVLSLWEGTLGRTLGSVASAASRFDFHGAAELAELANSIQALRVASRVGADGVRGSAAEIVDSMGSVVLAGAAVADAMGLLTQRQIEMVNALGAAGTMIGTAIGGERGGAIGGLIGTALGLIASVFESADRSFGSFVASMSGLVPRIDAASGGLRDATQSAMDAIANGFNEVLEITGTFLTGDPAIAFQIFEGKNGTVFKVWVNHIMREFDSLEAAIQDALVRGVQAAEFGGASPAVLAALNNFAGSTVEQLESAIQLAFDIDRLAIPEAQRQLNDALGGFIDLFSRAVEELGGVGTDIILDNLIATLQNSRDAALGIQLSQEEIINRRIDAWNAERNALEAQLMALRADLLARAADIEARGAGARATIAGAEVYALAAEVGLRSSEALARGALASGQASLASAAAQVSAAEAIAAALAAIDAALGALPGLISDAERGIAIANGIPRPSFGGGIGGGSVGGSFGDNGAAEREEFAAWIGDIRLSLQGASDAGLSMHNELKTAIERIDEVTTSEEQRNAALRDFLELTSRDFLAPFQDVIDAAGRTDLGNIVARLQGGYQDALDQAYAIAEARAAAFGTNLGDEFRGLSGVINQAFGLELVAALEQQIASAGTPEELAALQAQWAELMANLPAQFAEAVGPFGDQVAQMFADAQARMEEAAAAAEAEARERRIEQAKQDVGAIVPSVALRLRWQEIHDQLEALAVLQEEGLLNERQVQQMRREAGLNLGVSLAERMLAMAGDTEEAQRIALLVAQVRWKLERAMFALEIRKLELEGVLLENEIALLRELLDLIPAELPVPDLDTGGLERGIGGVGAAASDAARELERLKDDIRAFELAGRDANIETQFGRFALQQQQLLDTFNDVFNRAVAAGQATDGLLLSLQQQMAAIEHAAGESIRTLLDELRGSDPSQTGASGLSSIRGRFESLLAAARGGDLDAYADLAAVSRDLIGAYDAQFGASSGAAAGIRNEIEALLGGLPGVDADPVVTALDMANVQRNQIIELLGGTPNMVDSVSQLVAFQTASPSAIQAAFRTAGPVIGSTASPLFLPRAPAARDGQTPGNRDREREQAEAQAQMLRLAEREQRDRERAARQRDALIATLENSKRQQRYGNRNVGLS